MEVHILGWKYEGIRGVNNLEISLTNREKPYQTSLLMMPNGTGKTTTLTLLRAIFDGTAETWIPEMVRSFDPKIFGVYMGTFRVKLLIEEQIYWVELLLNYSSGTAMYTTSRAGAHGGLEEGHRLPSYLKDIFTREFVKRFIFDGELANNILRSESDEAERALKYLYQIHRLEEMQAKINRIVEDDQKKAGKTKAKTERGVQQIREQKMMYETSLQRLEKEEKEVKKQLEEKQERINQLTAEIDEEVQADSEIRDLMQSINAQREKASQDIHDITGRLLEHMRNPNLLSQALSDKLQSLSSKMQQLKLPKTMSRQFFEELAEQHSCVCGRDITPVEKQAILTNAKDYLAEDQIGIINAVKSAVRDRIYTDIVQRESELLKQAYREKRQVDNQWEKLNVHIKDGMSEDVQAKQIEKAKLADRIKELEKKYEILTTTDRRFLHFNNILYRQNLLLCREGLEKEESRLAQATNTLKLLKSSEKVKRYLQAAEQLALQKLKESIVKETNEKLQQIIQTESIEVEKIDRHLVLKNKTGTSVGQALAIAYSYLGSLFQGSTHQLPFVVDSPAGALDLSVRREVSKIIPSLFNQVIVFITSGEREGFAEHFYDLGEEHVQFITISKTKETGTECMEGIQFFQTFQDTVEI